MDKVFVGGISPEGEQLLRSYLDNFLPTAVIEPLKAVGIKGKMRNHAVRQDVALVIIDESLCQACQGVADDVLALPKVHRYVNDDGLKQFLVSKFGELDSVDLVDTGDTLDLSPVDEEPYIQHQDLTKNSSDPTPLPDVLLKQQEEVSAIVETSNPESDAIIEDLRNRLAKSELLVRNLSLQLQDKTSDDMSDLIARIRELEQELELKASETGDERINTLEEQLKTANDEKSALVDENDGLLEQIRELKTQVVELDVLKSDVANKSTEIESLSNKVAELEEIEKQLNEFRGMLAEKEAEIVRLNELIENSSDADPAQVSELKAQIVDLTEKLEQAEKTLSEMQEMETEFNKEIESLGDNKDMLEHKEAEIEALRADIQEKRAKIVELTDEVKRLNEEITLTNDSKEVLSNAYNTAVNEKKELAEKIASLEEEIIKYKGNGITSVSSEEVDRIKEELFEEKRKTAKLESEIEVLKMNDDSIKSSELRVKIASLEQELGEARRISEDSSELDSVKEELATYKERCTSLELEMVDKDEQIKGYSVGIFGQLANIAQPKLAYSASIPLNLTLPDNFCCIVSGSDESSSALYQVLKRTCITDTSKRILILDLSVDSSIDKELGITKIVSPIEWLVGAKPFKEFVASTGYANVRVMSTALAYVNDLYFLQVDWESRLRELIGSADAIVINIGDLNSVITKVLFNTFSKIMKTYVIAKSTPINLRSVYLNLSGLQPLSNKVVVECVNFDDKTSKVMYQRLAKDYNTQILKNTDILKF